MRGVFENVDLLFGFGRNLIALSRIALSYIIFFINKTTLPLSRTASFIGFATLLIIFLQLITGFYLGWYYIPEPGLIVELREEVFVDTRFGAEMFYLHTAGVDVIFALTYFHIFQKLYFKNFITANTDGWVLGGYAFFWFHYVVALGIVLGASHLSDVLLTVAANFYRSLFDASHDIYYTVFTSKNLTADQLTRFMLLHYLTPWYYLYLLQLHVLFCHESNEVERDAASQDNSAGSHPARLHDVFLKELCVAWFTAIAALICTTASRYIALCYWGTACDHWSTVQLSEVRFYNVTPHWYFRPLIGLLVASPSHASGLLWILLFFVLLTFLPSIYIFYNNQRPLSATLSTGTSVLQSTAFAFFIISVFSVAVISPQWYVSATNLGFWAQISFQYIYFYLLWLIHHLDTLDTRLFRFVNIGARLIAPGLANDLSKTAQQSRTPNIKTANRVNSLIVWKR